LILKGIEITGILVEYVLIQATYASTLTITLLNAFRVLLYTVYYLVHPTLLGVQGT